MTTGTRTSRPGNPRARISPAIDASTVDTPSGETKTVTNRYVGTVTEFKPGKSIEVMTGNKESHAFELDGKSDIVTIDRATAVGSKVTLVEEKGEKGFHSITVTIAPAA